MVFDLFLAISLSIFFLQNNAFLEGCQQKWFPDAQTFVCTCSAQFCDEPQQIGPLENGQILFYYSEKGTKRLERIFGKFNKQKNKNKSATTILVDPSIQFQTIFGFGGAFSDAVGLNLNALSKSTREKLLRAYFDPKRGIGYSLGRIPIASTDFSTREYSYLEEERDFDLETFKLAPEDLEAKIPHIKVAQEMSGHRLRLFAVPWSAPAWMKTNGKMSGDGEMKGDLDGPFYWAYARYLKRFLDEYSVYGINFWALTIQNQPESGLEKDFPFQAMFFSNHSQRKFAARLLVPLLRESPHTANIELIAFDDVREHLISSTKEIFAKDGEFEGSIFRRLICGNKFLLRSMFSILPEFILKTVENFFGCQNDEGSANLIAGIGIHWYLLDKHKMQTEIHQMFPDKFILPTEACTGFLPDDQGPRLGNWTRGWMYGRDIVQNMRNWAVGWVDWNLCLNMEGGPNWINNFVDAPILVDAANDEFHKQPMFYFLAHFSRFVPSGSLRIDSSLLDLDLFNSHSSPIDHVAFLTPNGQKVLVLICPILAEYSIDLFIKEKNGGEQNGMMATFTLEPGSILTAIWA